MVDCISEILSHAAIELNIRREIPYLRVPMCYSVYNSHSKTLEVLRGREGGEKGDGRRVLFSFFTIFCFITHDPPSPSH